MTRQEQFASEREACLKRWQGRGKIGDWGFLIHHGVPVEMLTQPIASRVDYIIAEKPASEIPTRLEWLRPVPLEALPARLVEARKAYTKAWKAYAEAGKPRVEARKAYVEARKARVEAGKAYVEAGKARVEAGKAYVEAGKAYAEAREAYGRDMLRSAHPDCPYDYEAKTLRF